jgi:hypothetical protein
MNWRLTTLLAIVTFVATVAVTTTTLAGHRSAKSASANDIKNSANFKTQTYNAQMQDAQNRSKKLNPSQSGNIAKNMGGGGQTQGQGSPLNRRH